MISRIELVELAGRLSLGSLSLGGGGLLLPLTALPAVDRPLIPVALALGNSFLSRDSVFLLNIEATLLLLEALTGLSFILALLRTPVDCESIEDELVPGGACPETVRLWFTGIDEAALVGSVSLLLSVVVFRYRLVIDLIFGTSVMSDTKVLIGPLVRKGAAGAPPSCGAWLLSLIVTSSS